MKRMLICAAICIGLVFLIFSLTSPGSLPAFLLIAPFLLIFAALICLFMVIAGRGKAPTAHTIRVATLCASVPVSFLVLQSIGQLTLRDVLTISILFALVYFYISRMAPKTK